MSNLSTKLKVILIVFAVLIGFYAIQFVVTYIANSSRSREHFENDGDSGDETPVKKKEKKAEKFSEKEKKKEEPKASDNDKVVDKQIKLNVLETVEDVFGKLFPDSSDKKPLVFNALMDKERFTQIKERYQNAGGDITSLVTNMIKRTMEKFEPEEEEESAKEAIASMKPNMEAYNDKEVEDMDKKPLTNIIEKMEEDENIMRLRSQLDNVVEKIGDLKTELKKLEEDTQRRRNQERAEEMAKMWKGEKFTEKKAGEDKEPVKAKSKNKGDVIEGFENRINYAYY